MKRINQMISPFLDNNTAVSKRERIESVRNEALNNNPGQGFNPKVARYKSNKGVTMRKKDNTLLVMIQLVPIALLTAYILAKMFM
jgi:hypothetical protein